MASSISDVLSLHEVFRQSLDSMWQSVSWKISNNNRWYRQKILKDIATMLDFMDEFERTPHDMFGLHDVIAHTMNCISQSVSKCMLPGWHQKKILKDISALLTLLRQLHSLFSTTPTVANNPASTCTRFTNNNAENADNAENAENPDNADNASLYSSTDSSQLSSDLVDSGTPHVSPSVDEQPQKSKLENSQEHPNYKQNGWMKALLEIGSHSKSSKRKKSVGEAVSIDDQVHVRAKRRPSQNSLRSIASTSYVEHESHDLQLSDGVETPEAIEHARDSDFEDEFMGSEAETDCVLKRVHVSDMMRRSRYSTTLSQSTSTTVLTTIGYCDSQQMIAPYVQSSDVGSNDKILDHTCTETE